jgi:hypothetical protein
MKSKVNYALIIICIASLAIISCRSFLDRVTPADAPKAALTYAGKDPNIVFASLYDVRELRGDIIVKHRTAQTDLLRQAEDDKYAYQDAYALTESSIREAEYLQDIIVGNEKQPFSILGILAGFTGGAAIGKALKRKGDLSPDEAQAAVLKAKEDGWNECETYAKAKPA